MKKLLIFTALLAYASLSVAQDFKFGKVSKEELQEKVHPIDSSANAAVLYRNEDISFLFTQSDGFMQQREVHERIKIYNKEGYDWATHKIYLYDGSSGASTEKISGLKGYTYNLVNGKVEDNKLKKDGIFEEQYNDFTVINTLTMPNIQDGCIIEFKYTIVSPFYQIDDIYFQKTIPINKLDVRVATPQYMSYNALNNIKASYFPKFRESKESKTIKTVNSQRSGVRTSSTEFSRSQSKYTERVITASEDNIPALKTEAFSGNMNNYISKMSMELNAILNQYGAPTESFSYSWEKVSESIYKRQSFGGQIERTNFFEDDITPLLAGIDDPFQKAAILTSYVKSKVKWNGYFGVSAYNGTKDAYKEGQGNVADINLLLIAMLKTQGVNANPVLVSTRDNGVPLYPTRKGFNYVVCMVESQDQYVLIDASEQYGDLNILPERALNWQGRLIKDGGVSSWVSLVPSQQSQQSSSLNVKIQDDLNISGKVRQIITSNMALRYKRKYDKMSADDKVKSLENDKGAIEVSETNMETKDNGAFSISYAYKLNDAVDDIGGKLYFSPLLFMAEKENPFKLDQRQYPIDFTMPLKDKNIVNIMMPEGYTVEALPQSEVMKFKDGAVTYSFVAKQNGNYIQLSTELDLKSPIIDSADYAVFKEFYGKIVEKQAEQVVLKKI